MMNMSDFETDTMLTEKAKQQLWGAVKLWRRNGEFQKRAAEGAAGQNKRAGKIQVLLCDSTEEKQEKRLKWQESWFLDLQPLALGPAADHVEL